MSTKDKLFKKDFTLIVIGQIISLFGNGIVRFALPLYLLDQTGSPTLFGLVSALSFLPMILLMPIGGIIADRLNKRNIMVILDFSTALLMVVLFILLGKVDLVILLIVVLMILFSIYGAYQPSVQASMPILLAGDHLLQGNAIINQVSALASMLSPILGGVLYGAYGIKPIIVIGGICFFVSAVMEMFIKIPHEKKTTNQGVFSIVKQDILESIRYIKNDNPIIFKSIWIISGVNLFLSSFLTIGLPVIVKQTLGLSDELYGIALGVLGLGGIVGGVFVGVFAKKLRIENASIYIGIAALLLLPIGVTLLLNPAPIISYIVIATSSFLIMCSATMLTVQLMTYLQSVAPEHLVGKIISLVIMFAICSQPIGQGMYGFLFEQFELYQYAIAFGGAFISLIIAFLAKNAFNFNSR